MSYQLWNTFVDVWSKWHLGGRSGPASFNGWTDPNTVSLLNTPGGLPTMDFLPEPWWGNDGSTPLHSVVINYNPGKGGGVQRWLCSHGLFGHSDYQAFVRSEVNGGIGAVLTGTTGWHDRNRAKPVFGLLQCRGVNTAPLMLQNHLSIEMIPWHTTDANSIGAYVQANLACIHSDVFGFAAQEAQRIMNGVLRNTVLIKMSAGRIFPILKAMQANGICQFQLVPSLPNHIGVSNNTRCMKFTLSSHPGTTFTAIWGTTSRNRFPPINDMAVLI